MRTPVPSAYSLAGQLFARSQFWKALESRKLLSMKRSSKATNHRILGKDQPSAPVEDAWEATEAKVAVIKEDQSGDQTTVGIPKENTVVIRRQIWG